MDDLTLADMVLTLDDDIDTNMSNETHVVYDKTLTLTIKWQKDIFEISAKLKDFIMEIKNSNNKSKSDKNLWIKYNFP